MKGATRECPFCLAEIPAEARKCRHCGEWVSGERGGREDAGGDQSLQRFWESENLDDTLNVGIKWYVKYRIVMAIVGFIVFLIFLFGVFLPTRDRINGPGDFGPELPVILPGEELPGGDLPT